MLDFFFLFWFASNLTFFKQNMIKKRSSTFPLQTDQSIINQETCSPSDGPCGIPAPFAESIIPIITGRD